MRERTAYFIFGLRDLVELNFHDPLLLTVAHHTAELVTAGTAALPCVQTRRSRIVSRRTVLS